MQRSTHLRWLMSSVVLFSMVSFQKSSVSCEENLNAGESSSRDPRILGALTGLGRARNQPNSHQSLAEVQSKISILLEKIESFEKIRAKLADAKPIFHLLQKLSNICPPNTNSFKIGSTCFEHQTQLWMDYDTAIIYCSSRGGYLAKPNITDSSYLENLRNFFPSLGDESVLVGITDISSEGEFEFMDGSPVSPDRFYGGKFPKNAEKDCVSLLYAGGFGLVDTTCKRLHEVLCEYDTVNLLPEIIGDEYLHH